MLDAIPVVKWLYMQSMPGVAMELSPPKFAPIGVPPDGRGTVNNELSVGALIYVAC